MAAGADRRRDAGDYRALFRPARCRRTDVPEPKRESRTMTDIAFIGLGNMGGPMAANLTKAGRKVTGFDLVPASRDAAKADGVAIAASALEAVKGAQVVVTMLPAGKHGLSVWAQILPLFAKGSLMIDCSTIDVKNAVQAHALAMKQGIALVDAPGFRGNRGP